MRKIKIEFSTKYVADFFVSYRDPAEFPDHSCKEAVNDDFRSADKIEMVPV